MPIISLVIYAFPLLLCTHIFEPTLSFVELSVAIASADKSVTRLSDCLSWPVRCQCCTAAWCDIVQVRVWEDEVLLTSTQIE